MVLGLEMFFENRKQAKAYVDFLREYGSSGRIFEETKHAALLFYSGKFSAYQNALRLGLNRLKKNGSDTEDKRKLFESIQKYFKLLGDTISGFYRVVPEGSIFKNDFSSFLSALSDSETSDSKKIDNFNIVMHMTLVFEILLFNGVLSPRKNEGEYDVHSPKPLNKLVINYPTDNLSKLEILGVPFTGISKIRHIILTTRYRVVSGPEAIWIDPVDFRRFFIELGYIPDNLEDVLEDYLDLQMLTVSLMKMIKNGVSTIEEIEEKLQSPLFRDEKLMPYPFQYTIDRKYLKQVLSDLTDMHQIIYHNKRYTFNPDHPSIHHS